jgi:hypothetical protein
MKVASEGSDNEALGFDSRKGRSGPLDVLLDQNHWIYLARAFHGKPHRPAHAAIVEPLLASVRSGAIRLPISSMHLIELLRTESSQRRHRLAEVLERFGGGWFMAAWSQILPTEINRAVALALEQPSPPPRPHVFGRGFLYGIPLAARDKLFQRFSQDSFDRLVAIAALPGAILDLVDFPNEDGRNRQNTSIVGRSRDDAASVEDSRRLFRDESKSLHRRVKLARYTLDFQDQIVVALSSLGLQLPDFLSRGSEFLTRFWSRVPSLHVDCELTLYRDRQWSRVVEPNDFVDLSHLVMGLPNCSVVVVEKFWARAIAETGLAREYGTKVFTDLEELGTILGV